jgi:hypothetical protein
VNAAVTVPGEFDEPRLTFDRLRNAKWVITPAPGEKHARVDVTLPDLYVANPDAEIDVSGTYTNPGHGRGSLDLRAEFARAAVARIPRYLPTGMSERLRAYLGHALQDGRVTKGASIVARGPLEKFPFEHEPDAGVFHIVAPFTGGRFEPTPYPPRKLANGTPSVWPALDGIDGVFELAQNKLRFDITRALQARRADERQRPDRRPRQSVEVAARDRRPRARAARRPDRLRGQQLARHDERPHRPAHRRAGPGVALKITIPQHVPHPHTHVEGALAFGGNTLSTDGVPPLSALRGSVRSRRPARRCTTWPGASSAGRCTRTAASSRTARTRSTSTASSRSTPPAAEPARHGRGAARTRGRRRAVRGRRARRAGQPAADHRALRPDGRRAELPAPFAKPAGEPMPFRFTLQPATPAGGKRIEHADLTLGPVSATYLLDATRGQPLRALRGAMGIHRMPDLPQDGVSAAVDVDELDADAWLALAHTLKPDTPRTPEPPPEAPARSRIDVASFTPKRSRSTSAR